MQGAFCVVAQDFGLRSLSYVALLYLGKGPGIRCLRHNGLTFNLVAGPRCMQHFPRGVSGNVLVLDECFGLYGASIEN